MGACAPTVPIATPASRERDEIPRRWARSGHARPRSRSLRAVSEEAIDTPAGAPSSPDGDGAGGGSEGRARGGGPRALDGVSAFMGLRWDDPQTVRLRIRPELINGGGLLSGVATYAMVDYCMGSTLWAQTSAEEHIATISIAVNYVQTATEGEIVCRTTLDRRNRSNGGDAQRGAPRGRAAAGDGDRQLHDLPRAPRTALDAAAERSSRPGAPVL